jgi:CRISPR system Cascade subunit CasE
MQPLFLSRARLRSLRGEALGAIAPILVPHGKSARANLAHRLVWLLFQDLPDSRRDFLWREEDRGRYLILSRRPPSDPHGLFDLETKLYEPALAPGDRLAFVLRANPVLTTKRAGTKPTPKGRLRGKRVDVVMDALSKVPTGQRAAARSEITARSGRDWLAQQGARYGFKLVADPVIVGNSRFEIERRRGRVAGIAVLDLKGVIEVTDADAFLTKMAQGFGAAKAFGNGLMLIRRA